MTDDKNWAFRELMGPLTGPEPADDGGITSPTQPCRTQTEAVARQAGSNPGGSRLGGSRHAGSQKIRKAVPADIAGQNGYPSPPKSASPRRDRFSYTRVAADQDVGGAAAGKEPMTQPSRPPSSRHRQPQPQQQPSKSRFGENFQETAPPAARPLTRLQRGQSLSERFPGDRSHRPLAMLKHDSKLAHRSPHLQRKHLPGADTIDRLDVAGGRYHHEGPYDAALLARNLTAIASPVEAVRYTNEQALRATPCENIVDAVERHRPLDGTASIPPGMADRFGRIYDYEEGADLMRETGADYKRWPGLTYAPDDLKGKGEPSFSLDRDLKAHRRGASDSYEMQPWCQPYADRRRPANDQNRNPYAFSYDGNSVRRRNSTGHKLGDGIKRRLTILRRRIE